MTITVNTAAPHKRLTSLPAVKRELDLSTTIDNDKLLEDLIEQASDFIHDYCDKEFARETVTETIQSRGGPILMTARTPIQSITYIELDGSSVSSTAYEIDDADAGMIWKEDGFSNTIITDSIINEYPTKHGRRNWAVKYVAGYVLPNSTQGARTLPYDLERACINIVKSWFLDRKADPNLRYQKIGDAAEARFDSLEAVGLGPTTLGILNRYRRFDLNRTK
jgi:hypothetical protein